MANYSTLKAAVADVVKTNGTQAITGANLQAVLLSIINSVGGGGYIFKGVATTSTDAGTPDENVFYIGGAGTYANFGTSVTVPVGSICVFKYNGSWVKEQIALFAGIDDVPTANSNNLVKSGGVYSLLNMFIQLTKTEWAGAISDIYIYPDYINSSAEYHATSNSTELHIGMYLAGSYSWFAKCSPTENGKIYNLVISSGSLIGTTIGQIVFKNYETILTNTYTGSGNKLSVPYISNLSFQPLIAISPIKALIAENTGAVFSNIGLLNALIDLYNKELLICDGAEFHRVGNGNTFNSFGAGKIQATPFLGRKLKVTFDSLTTTGDTSTSAIAIRFYNGTTFISESATISQGATDVVNVPTSGIDFIQLQCYLSASSHSTANVMYTFKVSIRALQDDETFDFPNLHIPSNIYAKKDEAVQLYKRGMIQSYDPYIYSHNLIGNGVNPKEYERYFEIIPSSTGSKTLRYYIINNEYEKSDEKTSVLHCAGSVISPSSSKNILCLGSSTTEDGVWAGEFKRRLVGSGGTPAGLGLTNLNFVGRQSTSHDVNVEAIGGWSFRKYINGVAGLKFTLTGSQSAGIDAVYSYLDASSHIVKIRICESDISLDGTITTIYNWNTEYSTLPASSTGTLTKISGTGDSSLSFSAYQSVTYSPLIYNNAFTFTHYAQKYCNGSVDFIAVLLGPLNYGGLTGTGSLVALMADVKTFVDKLHTDFPSCKIILSPCVGVNSRGCGADSGSWGVLVLEMRFLDALDDFVNQSEYSSFCYIVDSLAEFDMDYGFPTTSKSVNPRVNETEIVGTNMLHPNNAGSLMTADSFFRCFINTCL